MQWPCADHQAAGTGHLRDKLLLLGPDLGLLRGLVFRLALGPRSPAFRSLQRSGVAAIRWALKLLAIEHGL